MSWFWIAIIPPALYAAGNYVDKAILSKRVGGGIGTIIIFSCFLGTLTIPFILWLEPNALSISPLTAGILIINGALTVIAVLCYLYAIEEHEISGVIPLLQLTPVFGFIIGYLLLGETLSSMQIIGSAIIIIGALIISLDFGEVGELKIRRKVLLMATVSAFIFSINGAIFKFFAIDEGYWRTQFWEYIGIAILGIIFFMAIPNYRQSFLSVFKKNSGSTIGLNIIAEAIMFTADLTMNFATLLAPVALIYVVNSFQPVFVFVLGIILTILIPNIINESMERRRVIQKVLTISVMTLGLLMLYY